MVTEIERTQKDMFKRKMKIGFVIASAIFNLLIVILHISFWEMFNWKEELQKVTMENSVVVQMMNLFIILLVFAVTFILIRFRKNVVDTFMGRIFILMIAFLYLGRLVMEFVFPGGSVVLALIMIVVVVVHIVPGFPLHSSESK